MPTDFKINLQDMAKIALSGPELTDINTAILHSLIDILLKKLNCQNETVSLSGFDSQHLEKILKTAKISPLVFNDENIEIISEKFEHVEKLKKSVTNLDEKLDKHLQEAQRESNFKETIFTWENWASYGCEDLCTTCDAENEIACKLLKNTDFLKKFLRQISAPVVDRMFYFEEKIQKLSEEFNNFMERIEKNYFQVQLLEKCVLEIENLHQKLQNHKTHFLSAMEEIQDILDTKLDKIHIPALKKYIRDNFQLIDQRINTLQTKQQCPRAAGIIMEGLRCVSCGYNKVCSEADAQPAIMFADMKVKAKQVPKFYECSCENKDTVVTSIVYPAKHSKLKDPIKIKRSEMIHDENKKKNELPKCRKAGEDFDLLEGFDGNLYRKG